VSVSVSVSVSEGPEHAAQSIQPMAIQYFIFPLPIGQRL